MLNRIYHLALSDIGGARFAILPGDPGRVEKIAMYLENPVKMAQNREFVTYSGSLLGSPVLVTSTGIGGPSAAIAMEELAALGVDTFIRVGTCGGMQREVLGGNIVIPTGAIRMEGTSQEYLPVEFPAVPDFAVLSALVGAAALVGATDGGKLSFHTGVVQSKDSFYGQHEPQRMPVALELEYKWQAYIKGGALASEMECASLFCVAACLKVRVGAVLACVWNQERARDGLANPDCPETDDVIKVAIKAIESLISQKI